MRGSESCPDHVPPAEPWRRSRVVAGAAALPVGSAAGGSGASPALPRASEPVRRVLVLSLPGTTWAAMARAATPNLDALLAGPRWAARRCGRSSARHGRATGTSPSGRARPPSVSAAWKDWPTTALAASVSRARPELAEDAERRHRGAEVGALG